MPAARENDGCSLAMNIHKQRQASDDRSSCLKNPRPAGAESSLTERTTSPFQTEPRHILSGKCQLQLQNHRQRKLPLIREPQKRRSAQNTKFARLRYAILGGMVSPISAYFRASVRPMKSVGLLIVAAMVSASGACAQSARKAAAQPNVFLVTIDTLRADHVHCYGYESIQT